MDLKGKKLAVIGLGVSGQAAFEFLFQEGAEVILVNRGAPETWNLRESSKIIFNKVQSYNQDFEGLAEVLASMDMIILSPGIPRELPLFEKALQHNIPLINEIELASQFCPYPIIGITGTNGKTTTVSLLAEALKGAGKKVFLGGNIGLPFCEWAKEKEELDYVVLELSSFQLESVPSLHLKVAAILNLADNHGERYESSLDYFKAKLNIFKNQTPEDLALIGEGFEGIEVGRLNSKTQSFPKDNFLNEIPQEKFLLPGLHNKKNLWFVTQIFKFLNLDLTGLYQAMENFPGVAHRLERLKGANLIFNDAKSTNWSASISAVSSLEEFREPLWLICGGQRRGKNDELTQEQLDILQKRCEKVLAFGESAPQIKKQITEAESFETLEQLWNSLKNDIKGKCVLFSPAYPSFDQYKNYIQRGEAFKKLVSDA